METRSMRIPEFLSGGGEAGEILRTKDWTKTPLGDPNTWPQSLKTCVRIILTSTQPMFVWWGKDLINIYNDSYKAIVGGKHPGSFGAPAHEVWKEIWHEVFPRTQTVMEQNIGTYDESLLLIMERNGYPEETYYTFSYSPIPGDNGGVGGIICANTDNTDHIINERSIQTLRDLANITYTDTTIETIYQNASAILHKNSKDFPFALFYKIDDETKFAEPVAWAGDKKEYHGFPSHVDLTNPVDGTRNLCKAVETNQLMLVDNGGRRKDIPKGFWDIVPQQFLHIPINRPNKNKPLAILTMGLNPYRKFNDTYRNFIKIVADQISSVVNNLLAYEEERKRVEALEEIDKAKTHFFSNISHEFRTPLTLILGPLENVLNAPHSHLSTQENNTLRSAHRNTLRLLRLVNMLLEFSRIEAGRMEARYEPVDLSSFTADLASSFRSMIENAGMTFTVTIAEGLDRVYVDRDMWEKIVLNLISNAFKYTLSGEISVTAEKEKEYFVLRIKDTGVGIPANELPHMFERFHRIQNSQGRSFEGTGIGLSLVYELVKLHGGTIAVESTEGKGSTFTVRLPFGRSHLPEQHILKESSAYMASSLINSFVTEANEQPALKQKETAFKPKENKKAKILVVDDNADMREYIKNLLDDEYDVQTAVNGEDALEKISREKPGLILSDIMMPVMDGNQLLQNLRGNLTTANIPVIFLSARAGDEAKAQGLESGADDYLVKPFSSMEILSRVKAQIKLSASRLHVAQQLNNVFAHAPVAMCILRGPELKIEVANARMLELWGKREVVLGKPVSAVVPEMKEQGVDKLLSEVYATGVRYISEERPLTFVRDGISESVFLKLVFEALRDEEGNITGVMAVANDITPQVIARKKIEDSEQRYKYLIASLPIAVYTCDAAGYITLFNQAAAELWGCEPVLKKDKWCGSWKMYKADGTTPVSLEESPMARLLNGETDVEEELVIEKENGERYYVQPLLVPVYDRDGKLSGSINMLINITDKKNAQKELEQIIVERTKSLVRKNEELKTSEERYHRMTEEVQDYAIILLDKDGNIMNWNNGARKIKGYQESEIIGKHFRIFYLPEDVENYMPEKFLSAAVERGRAETEGWRKRKDGTMFWGSVVMTALHDDKDNIIGFSKVTRDLTERKKAEDIMKTYMAELEKQNTELEQFAYVSSHDLQEPLRKIRTFSALLEEEIQNDAHRNYLQKINSSAERMSSLIKDLLQYSRLSKEGEAFVTVDLNQILQNVKTDLEVAIEQKKATITNDPFPPVKGIALQFNQLFLNLLTNSLKFNTGRPVIHIGVQSAPLYEIIAAKLDSRWSYIKITFSDNGIGFEPEFSEQIFTIFQRLNTRQKFSGTGIGLAMCKKIVDNHHGFIKAEGNVDAGATFIIYLPLK